MFKSIKKMFKKKSRFTLLIKNHFNDGSFSVDLETKTKFYHDYILPLMSKYDVIVFDFRDVSYTIITVAGLMSFILKQYAVKGVDKSELLGRFDSTHQPIDYLINSNKSPDEYIRDCVKHDKLEKETENKTSQYFTILNKELESIKKENRKPIYWVFDFDGTILNNRVGAVYINPGVFGIDWCILSYRPWCDYSMIKNLMRWYDCPPYTGKPPYLEAFRRDVILCSGGEWDGDTTNLTKIANFKIKKLRELSERYHTYRIVYVDNKTALTKRMAEFGFTDSMTLPQFIETVKDKSFPDLTRKY